MAKQLRWRVQSNDDGGFDELVVAGPGENACLVHAEMMDDRSIFVSVGDLLVWAYVDKKTGTAIVSHTERCPYKKKRKPAQRHGEGK